MSKKKLSKIIWKNKFSNIILIWNRKRKKFDEKLQKHSKERKKHSKLKKKNPNNNKININYIYFFGFVGWRCQCYDDWILFPNYPISVFHSLLSQTKIILIILHCRKYNSIFNLIYLVQLPNRYTIVN